MAERLRIPRAAAMELLKEYENELRGGETNEC
jgi:hypothetical protein